MTWQGIRWAFTTDYTGNWLPLTWLSHMIDFSLYGMNPAAFRLTNVLLHTVSSIALFAALRAMTNAPGRSFLVAALFAIHPLHVESVVWIAERKDALSGLFWMLTLAAYTHYIRRRGPARYALVAAVFALGLMAKPMIVTVPCVLLLLDLWPLNRVRDTRALAAAALEKLPLFALSIADSLVTWFAQDAAGTIKAVSTHSWPARVANAAVAYASYITKSIYPFDLAVLYPHREGAVPMPIIALCASMIVIVSISSVVLLRRAPWFTVGWFWYLGTLVPVIGLIQVGDQAMADRYTYIPLIGLFIVVVWGLHRLLSIPINQEMFKTPNQHIKIPAAHAFVAALLVLLTAQARVQVGYWRDSITLFEHCLEVTTTNGPAHNNLGRAYHDAGDLEKARMHYEQALIDTPELVIALNNLGLLELAEGNLEQAQRLLEQVAAYDPRDHRPRLNLGIVNAMRGQDEAAERWFRDALDIAPDFPATRYSYGVFLLERGRAKEAVGQLEHALRIQPDQTGTLAALERAKAAAKIK